MELVKNNRFRTGSMVDIYHTPVYESNSTSIVSQGISAGYFRLQVFFDGDLTIEQFGIGDLCALGFGVGVITAVFSTYVLLEFEQSSFVDDSTVMKYVGSGIQHALFFLASGRVESNYTVSKYKESVNQAVYGYSEVVYNLQTKAELLLVPIRMVDDGTLSKILYSKGFVLKSCNTDNYIPTTAWNQDFPLELSGTSIDPVYRRAFLEKRQMESKSRRSKATFTFKLIG